MLFMVRAEGSYLMGNFKRLQDPQPLQSFLWGNNFQTSVIKNTCASFPLEAYKNLIEPNLKFPKDWNLTKIDCLTGGLDTKEPWQGQWNGGVLVECVGRPGPELSGQTICDETHWQKMTTRTRFRTDHGSTDDKNDLWNEQRRKMLTRRWMTKLRLDW
jgi:hypothetical protein